ncbi:MAG: glycosyltransferase family 2 protein [Pseudomonadota bacterium]
MQSSENSNRINTPHITVVMPVYNEAENLEHAYKEIIGAIPESMTFEWLVVDDGSDDRSKEIILRLANSDKRIRYIFFSRNFGHQSAVRAGILAASGKAVVVMDADLQHPIDLLPEMIKNHQDGFDVVLTKRVDDEHQSSFKRFTSAAYYRLLSFLSDTKVIAGLADFYLLDRKVVEVVRQYEEVDLYLRGIIPSLGFNQSIVEYSPNKRRAGEVKYTFRRMARLAVNGILSMTVRPLRLATLLSVFVGVFALIYAFFALVSYVLFGSTIRGWTSVILVLSLIGAMQLFVLGLIGEYLGRVLSTSRKRPHFIVTQTNIDTPERNYVN